MKNTIKALAIIALVAVIGFSFTACGDGNGGGEGDGNGGGGGGGGGSNANVVGTWKGTDTLTYSGVTMTISTTWVFSADMTWSCSQEINGTTYPSNGTYTVSGNTVTCTNSNGFTYYNTVSGNTMTVPQLDANNNQIGKLTLRKQ